MEHTIDPVYDEHSRILILGSFPSVKSREQKFFYGHKQNRFWKVLAGILGCEVPQTIEEKKAMLLEHHIAVWDVIQALPMRASAMWSQMICPKYWTLLTSRQSIRMAARRTSCTVNIFTR